MLWKKELKKAVLEKALKSGIDADVQVMAIDDRFVEQGNVALLREEIGISYKNIYEKVMELTR